MKALIVYDSVYGNTEKIAKAIGEGLAGDVTVIRAGETGAPKIEDFDLIIVGSPIHGGRPTPAVQSFIDGAGPALKGKKAAAFDTRITNWFAKIFDYAAARIADSLKANGCSLVVEPEGFSVNGRKGPLKEGELERAASWAKQIMDGLK
ncbi:MAG TPA: flavodoxin family protein [Candidatus Bathyarchaeia archaeon]